MLDERSAADDAAIQDFLLILEEHKKNCERQGKYIEADIAKKRLEELRQHELSRCPMARSLSFAARQRAFESAHQNQRVSRDILSRSKQLILPSPISCAKWRGWCATGVRAAATPLPAAHARTRATCHREHT